SENYSLEQAKADGCVVHEDLDVTYGKDIFEAFYTKAEAGEKAYVRLAFYYTLGAPHYDPYNYGNIGDVCPVLYVQDLTFDGEKYTLRWYEDGKEIVESYDYLMKYNEPVSIYAIYDSSEEYILTNDNTVTRQNLWNSVISSQLEDHIDYHVVCADFIYE
ncbi:MAG: hypothetical protein K2N71_05030, partial [Oscillospiraceae bacterium]|nr:hypothetical protein [Oscillospiraceae bacterium]